MNEEDKQIIINLVKSMHKCVLKAIHYDKQKTSVSPVQDVVDSNYTKDADETQIPARNTGVMYKTEDLAKKLAEKVVDKYLEIKKK